MQAQCFKSCDFSNTGNEKLKQTNRKADQTPLQEARAFHRQFAAAGLGKHLPCRVVILGGRLCLPTQPGGS